MVEHLRWSAQGTLRFARALVIGSFAALIVTACVLACLGGEAKSDSAMLVQKIVLTTTAVAGLAALWLGVPLRRASGNWFIAIGVSVLATFWIIMLQAHLAAAAEVTRARGIAAEKKNAIKEIR